MESNKTVSAMKWVGYATAVLSLIAAIGGLAKTVSSRFETRRQVNALLADEALQLKGQDYSTAWQSLEKAAQIDPDSSKIREAQESLAMEWLENVHLQENEKFSTIAEKLDPVLARGAASAKSPADQADRLAHLGWSYFLRSRDGNFGLDPAASYADAIKRDANNPYANAMWGHWILWNNGEFGDAEKRFNAALASHRQQAFVRRLELSALMNEDTDRNQEEVIRVANAIRLDNGTIDQDMRHRIYSFYYDRLSHTGPLTAAFVNAISPAEHVATFQWMFGAMPLDDSGSNLRLYYLCYLKEAAGQRDEALAGYQQLKQKIGANRGSLADGVDKGIKRLSR